MVKSRLKKSAPECPFECGGGGCNCYLGNAQKEVASFKKGLPLPPILKKSSNWNRDTPVPQKNSLLSPFSPIYLGTKWLKGSRAMLSWVSDRNLLSYRELSNNFGFSQNGFHSFCNRKSQHLTFSNQYFIILAASIHNSNSMTELRATFCKIFLWTQKRQQTRWQQSGSFVLVHGWEDATLFLWCIKSRNRMRRKFGKNAFNFFPSFLKKGFANGHAIE